MSGGRGFFAIGIHHPKTEVNVGTLWRSAWLMGAAFVFTVGRRYPRRQASDTPNVRLHLPLMHFADVDDVREHLPHACPLVGVELDPRARPLSTYGHLDRAAYLLGAEDHGLPIGVRDACHGLIQIESVRPQSMNVATAGALVMWHRHTQRAARRAEVPA